MELLEEILTAIKEYDTIIIHRHQRPDPDALGSQAGLGEILRHSFPAKKVLLAGGTVNDMGFLTAMDQVSQADYAGALVIVTDTANAPRISGEHYSLGAKLIKIDHHPDDEPYGDISWVKTTASSCSEMVFDFYANFKEELTLTQEGARILYAGIVGDTGRFLYPATTPHTLQVASELVAFGFDAAKLNRQLNEMPLSVALLSGYVLQHMEIDENGAGRVIVPAEILSKYGVDDSETSSLIPLPGQVEGVVAWGLFVEQPEGYYRVRLRSKGPAINEIAKAHHGGGHPLASGANAADLAEVDVIYAKIKKIVTD